MRGIPREPKLGAAMSDDDSPPPPPSSPPPSFDLQHDREEDTLPNFKALRQMLVASHTMYTVKVPAPPPKPKPIREVAQDSPKLEHSTRERPRRKTRAPSRTFLREKALFSGGSVFDTDAPETGRAHPIPSPPTAPSPPLSASSSSHPPSPLPPLPPSIPPSPPSSAQQSPLQTSSTLEHTTATSKQIVTATLTELRLTIANSSNMRDKNDKVSSSLATSQPKTSLSTHRPVISVVPFVSADKSAIRQQGSTSTFTARLRQIRERRAAQRTSPSPSALSPTHSASSLPQYLAPPREPGDPSVLINSSMSVSPVTSLASFDSSIQESTAESETMNTDTEGKSLRNDVENTVTNIKEPTSDSNCSVNVAVAVAEIPDAVTPTSPSTTPSPPPSSPPSPPPSEPPSLPSSTPLSMPLSLTSSLPIVSQTTNTRELEADGNQGKSHESLESLSSSSECPPELPALPPPPIPACFDKQEVQIPASSLATSSYLDSPPLLPDVVETMSFTGTESSTAPSISSGTSTPQKKTKAVQYRQQAQHPVKQHVQDRRSAFEAMLISESSTQKRLSVTDRRVLTLQASRRPDGSSNPRSNPHIKRWSDVDSLISIGSYEDDNRSKSALAMSETSERGVASDSSDIMKDREVHKRWRKQGSISNVANDSNDESNVPQSSSRSSISTEKTGDGDRSSGNWMRETALSPSIAASHPADKASLTTSDSIGGVHDESTKLPKFPSPGDLSPSQNESGIRSVDSLLVEASLHRHALGEELEGRLSSQLSTLQEVQVLQNRVVESRLAKMQEQQRDCERLLEGEPDVNIHTSTDEDIWQNTDDLESEPKTWTVDQVCEWLELIGLGTYRDTFRENGVDGSTLLCMDVNLFAKLGVDSAEIRELFLSKIYDLSKPSKNEGEMQDDFHLPVDSYTDQDWKKLEAAVHALKNPVLRDDIELDPSAIGQFLHTDYVHSLSTPNIHELQPHSSASETQLTSAVPPPSIPHSSTMNTLSNQAPVDLIAAADQVPRKARVPSTRSIKRQRILSMAEAGDKPVKGYASSHTTRASSAMSSMQGSPTLSRASSSHVDSALTSPNKDLSKTSITHPFDGVVTKSKRTSDLSPNTSVTTSAARLAKNLNQGVIVYENGKYRKIRLGSLQKQTTEDAMTSAYWDQPTSGHTTGLVRLYMESVQEGLHYKAFLVTEGTCAGELVELALQRAHITDNPQHYCIWQVASDRNATAQMSRVLTSSECPLTIQLTWPHFNSHHFELQMQENVHRVKFLLDLPQCCEKEVQLTLPTSATAVEAVQDALAALRLADTYTEQGIQCAVMDITSRSRAERALGEKECPVSLLKTGHKLKVVSLSGHKKHSAGQSDKALLARLHTLEQEKLMLTEQVESAQAMMRSYLEAEQLRSPQHTNTDSDQAQDKELQSPTFSGEVGKEGDDNKIEEETGLEGEQLIERLRKLNNALNIQLKKQREKIREQTIEKQGLEQRVFDLSNKDKEKVLEIGVLQMTIKGLKEQLQESENSRKQMQHSLQAIEKSQPHQLQLDTLQESLRRTQQEITRLDHIGRDREAKLQAAEQERLRAVLCVRQHVVHSNVETAEEEAEDMESTNLYKVSRTDLVKSCRHVNRELRQHKLYLDQLLMIVIDRHPEMLSMVTEAQKMRDLVDSESWC